MQDRKSMNDIRNALLKGEGNKLSKKEYKFAVEMEKSRLWWQLIFLTLVSFVIGFVLFISLYFDIAHRHIDTALDDYDH